MELSLLVPLEKANDSKRFGNKAYYLSLLHNLGFPTPKGFALGIEAMKKFVENLGKRTVAKEEFLESPLPLEVKKELETVKSYLKEPYSVRSSSPFEDTKEKASAGKYESITKVKKEELERAIKEVWYSAYKKGELMGVIIHEFVEGFSGVAFYDGRRGVIELSLNGSPTEGKTDLRVYFNDKRKYEFFNKWTLNFDLYITVNKLIEQLRELYEKVKFPIDVEFAINNNKVIFLQLRPFTGKIDFSEENETIIVLGDFAGKFYFVENEEKLKEILEKEEKVVVGLGRMENWLSKYLDAGKIVGVIVQKSSFTSHLTINLMEKGIPAIAFEKVDKIRDGSAVVVKSGRVIVRNENALN